VRAELRKLAWPERVFVAAALGWLGWFLALKLHGVFSPDWLEWDSRAMTLAAERFHGSGLFPRDLGADLSSAMCPPGWKLLYWIGTLFVSAHQVSRLLPFAIFGFLLWQTFAFARARGGIVVGALTVFLMARCPFVWDRIIGANPRAFGIPLVIAFLRYASDKRKGATALVLIAQAAFYPSVLLVCAPAWAVLMCVEAIRERKVDPLLWLALGGVLCAALVAPSVLGVDPRIGPAIRIEELAQLKQRAIWSLYPLLPHDWVFARAIFIPLQDDLPAALLGTKAAHVVDVGLALLAAVAFGVALLRRRLPLPFLVAVACSVGAYFVACKVAYRLYVPDRLVHYVWTPAILLLFGAACVELFGRAKDNPRLRTLIAAVLVALTVASSGTGLTGYSGLRSWTHRRSKTLDFVGTLPKDVLVLAHPALSSDVEVFAKRSVLFSGITNAPNFVTYGRTVEERITAFYDAYYAPNLDVVRQFVEKEKIDYLIVDLRDFGAEAIQRAIYVSPWTEHAQRRIFAARGVLALAHPPDAAIVFRDGPNLVLDAKKL
jgi:hypothetical protein